MSYLALARKYRPRKFEDVMGQGHVTQALQHALNADRLHPAILLTGTRGVGKTTLARIVAKGLNCETGVTANPCGQCSSCKEVEQGRFVDLLEIDAASNTGVDDVRVLIDNAQYAPARGRYKVYLIDEVHMLSKPAFNALLKTLEEPPERVKFILATTDPQKLLVTVLSRCLQFNLRRLPQSVIRDQIAKVLRDEGQAFEAGAIAELARAADGSMRDALSLTDQAIAFAGGGALQAEPVAAMLGTSGRGELMGLLQALATQDRDAVLALFTRLEAAAPDYAALLIELAALLQRLALRQLLPNAASDDDPPELAALLPQFAAEDVQLYYQMTVHGRRDLPYAPDPRTAFEMTVLRMLAFTLDTPEPPPRRAALPPSGMGTHAGGAGLLRGGAPGGPRAQMAEAANHAQPVAAPFVPPPALQVIAAPTPQPVADDADWAVRIEALALQGLSKQLARNAVLEELGPPQTKLLLDPRQKHLNTPERRAELEQALALQLSRPVSLAIAVAEAPLAHTPAAAAVAAAAAEQQALAAAIANDPAVQAFGQLFGATVRPGSMKRLD